MNPSKREWKLMEKEKPEGYELYAERPRLYKIAVKYEDEYRNSANTSVEGIDYFVPEGLWEWDENHEIFTRYGRSEAYIGEDVIAWQKVRIAWKGNGKIMIAG